MKCRQWLVATSIVLSSTTAFVFDRHNPRIQSLLSETHGDAFADLITETSPPNIEESLLELPIPEPTEQAVLCIIGGGVSGLTAALTAAKNVNGDAQIVLLESGKTCGGRVASDSTPDGFILNRGFAVFIEQYPFSKKLLDYDELQLGKFLPGALVKIRKNNGKDKLARVSDPLRRPADLLPALFSPIGSISDKLKLIPLILNVRRKSIDDLFEEPETSTAIALKERWKLSDEMVDKFFRPFLEGIFLSPLEEQSSRMFSFVFKMFSEGSATLPRGGMAAVSNQLEKKLSMFNGVEVRTNHVVTRIAQRESGTFIVETKDRKCSIEAKHVIVACDVDVSRQLLSQLNGLEFLRAESVQQRCVGCLYYTFQGKAPVSDPILILNGEGKARDSFDSPINNICFPSAVSEGYAPEGSGLCSVTILKGAMDAYRGQEGELDRAVRQQLGRWFPEYSKDIQEEWELKRIYYIPNAQPVQFGSFPATVNGGRASNTFLGKELPSGLFVCGDHASTASLNGALESGFNAGTDAAKAISASR